MKSIILFLLLLLTTAFSSQVVSNLVYSAPGVKIYVVTIITDTTNIVSQPTNSPTAIPISVTNSDISKLETKIQLEEKRIHEDYDGLPTYHADNATVQSEHNLNILMDLWAERDKSVFDLNVLKIQLEKLKNQR